MQSARLFCRCSCADMPGKCVLAKHKSGSLTRALIAASERTMIARDCHLGGRAGATMGRPGRSVCARSGLVAEVPLRLRHGTGATGGRCFRGRGRLCCGGADRSHACSCT